MILHVSKYAIYYLKASLLALLLTASVQAQEVLAQNYFASISSAQPAALLAPPARDAHWKRAWLKKLLQVSPRVNYGVGTFRASMAYHVPDLGASVSRAANELRGRFPWVPWSEVQLDFGDTYRQRQLQKPWKFFGTVGINLPLIFLDVETGSGRFSEPFITAAEVWPPWTLFRMDEVMNLLLKRVTTPEAKGALSLRAGVELERLLPDHWRPRLSFGPFATGIDVQAYYLLGLDFSYRVGLEVIDPRAVAHLQAAFDPIPFVPQKAKEEAAAAIVGHVEASLPTYFWAPATHGWGIGAEAFLDIGKKVRFHASYFHEQSQGMRLQAADWLLQGPGIQRQFFTIGITTQL
ncbi:MAG: hypothetical protein D6730_04000 [Bacteroidetes bacterium]|nr:MAG: hypothetical protein D6730_04000 [Bacteroidota bacterium]